MATARLRLGLVGRRARRLAVWASFVLALLPARATLHAAPAYQALPLVRISEVHASPRAVLDVAGEWVELVNVGDAPANLQGWTLGSNEGESHTIFLELIVQPGQYLVLGRLGDPAQNGGVQPAYVYNGLDLGNQADAIWLLDPTGQEVDRVAWGEGTGLAINEGASLERQGPDGPWTAAHSPWPGSAGDWGSPGAPYQPPPTPTPLPPTPTPPPAIPPRLAISELMIDPAAVPD
ncbi:MAG TPA: lamin tail domain-containing protein, partial [Caldilineaceae bacterium]|nr:lamin tail domain-containing protein [Caldilineaceae bacterium]